MTSPMYGGAGEPIDPSATHLYVYGVSELVPDDDEHDAIERGAGERVLPVMVHGSYVCKNPQCGQQHTEQIVLMLPLTLAANLHAIMDASAVALGCGPAFTARRDAAVVAIREHKRGGSQT